MRGIYPVWTPSFLTGHLLIYHPTVRQPPIITEKETGLGRCLMSPGWGCGSDSSATSCRPGDFPQSFWATEEPRLDVIICENLEPCMWKRLVTWHGNTALAGGLSWSSSAGLRKHFHTRHPGGGRGKVLPRGYGGDTWVTRTRA